MAQTTTNSPGTPSSGGTYTPAAPAVVTGGSSTPSSGGGGYATQARPPQQASQVKQYSPGYTPPPATTVYKPPAIVVKPAPTTGTNTRAPSRPSVTTYIPPPATQEPKTKAPEVKKDTKTKSPEEKVVKEAPQEGKEPEPVTNKENKPTKKKPTGSGDKPEQISSVAPAPGIIDQTPDFDTAAAARDRRTGSQERAKSNLGYDNLLPGLLSDDRVPLFPQNNSGSISGLGQLIKNKKNEEALTKAENEIHANLENQENKQLEEAQKELDEGAEKLKELEKQEQQKKKTEKEIKEKLDEIEKTKKARKKESKREKYKRQLAEKEEQLNKEADRLGERQSELTEEQKTLERKQQGLNEADKGLAELEADAKKRGNRKEANRIHKLREQNYKARQETTKKMSTVAMDQAKLNRDFKKQANLEQKLENSYQKAMTTTEKNRQKVNDAFISMERDLNKLTQEKKWLDEHGKQVPAELEREIQAKQAQRNKLADRYAKSMERKHARATDDFGKDKGSMEEVKALKQDLDRAYSLTDSHYKNLDTEIKEMTVTRDKLLKKRQDGKKLTSREANLLESLNNGDKSNAIALKTKERDRFQSAYEKNKGAGPQNLLVDNNTTLTGLDALSNRQLSDYEKSLEDSLSGKGASLSAAEREQNRKSAESAYKSAQQGKQQADAVLRDTRERYTELENRHADAGFANKYQPSTENAAKEAALAQRLQEAGNDYNRASRAQRKSDSRLEAATSNRELNILQSGTNPIASAPSKPEPVDSGAPMGQGGGAGVDPNDARINMVAVDAPQALEILNNKEQEPGSQVSNDKVTQTKIADIPAAVKVPIVESAPALPTSDPTVGGAIERVIGKHAGTPGINNSTNTVSRPVLAGADIAPPEDARTASPENEEGTKTGEGQQQQSGGENSDEKLAENSTRVRTPEADASSEEEPVIVVEKQSSVLDDTYPEDPGREYYEKFVDGTDWNGLSDSSRKRYAGRERGIRKKEDLARLRAEQRAKDEKEAQEHREWVKKSHEKLDQELAVIEEENIAAKEAANKRRQAGELRTQRRDANEKMKVMNDKIMEAHARGDIQERSRLEREFDAFSDMNAHLFELTEGEIEYMDEVQDVRDRLTVEIDAAASRLADARLGTVWREEIDPATGKKIYVDEGDALQTLKEGITSGTKHVSVGSDMQQQTAKTTRIADRELAKADAKLELIQVRLDDQQTTVIERKVLLDKKDMAELQKEGAERLLSDNANITAAGYAIDVALLLSGGVGNVLASVGSKAATKLAANAAAKTAFNAAIARGASRGAAQRIAQAEANKVVQTAVTKATASDAAARTFRSQISGGSSQKAAVEAAEAAALNSGKAVTQEMAVEVTSNIANKAASKLRQNIIPGADRAANSALGKSLAKHKLVQTMVADAAVGTTADVAIQLATTGEIDLDQTARAAIAGATFAGGSSLAGRSAAAVKRPSGTTTSPSATSGSTPANVELPGASMPVESLNVTNGGVNQSVFDAPTEILPVSTGPGRVPVNVAKAKKGGVDQSVYDAPTEILPVSTDPGRVPVNVTNVKKRSANQDIYDIPTEVLPTPMDTRTSLSVRKEHTDTLAMPESTGNASQRIENEGAFIDYVRKTSTPQELKKINLAEGLIDDALQNGTEFAGLNKERLMTYVGIRAGRKDLSALDLVQQAIDYNTPRSGTKAATQAPDSVVARSGKGETQILIHESTHQGFRPTAPDLLPGAKNTTILDNPLRGGVSRGTPTEVAKSANRGVNTDIYGAPTEILPIPRVTGPAPSVASPAALPASLPKRGPGDTQVLGSVPNAVSPQRVSNSSRPQAPPAPPLAPLPKRRPGDTQVLDAIPNTVLAQRLSNSSRPSAPKRPLTDYMVHRLRPKRSDPGGLSRIPASSRGKYQTSPAIGAQRVAQWKRNPQAARQLDQDVRQLLRVGGDAGSAQARAVIEQGIDYRYQPDADKVFAYYERSSGTSVINPNGIDGRPRSAIGIAGSIIHESVHGRGLSGGVTLRGGASRDMLGLTPDGYNEFRAHFEEAAFYYRHEKADPRSLDSLEPSQRAFARGFRDAMDGGGSQAAKDYINKVIEQRSYTAYYPVRSNYVRAVSQVKGGSNARVKEAQRAGVGESRLLPANTNRRQLPPAPSPPPLAPRPPTIIPGRNQPEN